MALFGDFRTFLVNLLTRASPPVFLRNVFLFNFLPLFQRVRQLLMGTQRHDSKAPSPQGDGPEKSRTRTQRQMVHLKTKEECRLGNETIQVWTVELPSKYAEGILKVIKENIEGQDSIDLQHLRRFAKPKYLPDHVLGERDLIKELYVVPRSWDAGPPTVMQTPEATWDWSSAGRRRNDNRPPTLYLLVCPSQVITLGDLHNLMIKQPPFCSSADSWSYPLEIKEITVPRLAPTSPEQAADWSDTYWPTFYRKTNPFGAHPSTIEKAEDELQQPLKGNVDIHAMMDLADEAGSATEKQGYGLCTGCVIVERFDDQTEIIAVAGDARLKKLPSEGAEDAEEDANADTNSVNTDKGKTKSGGGAFAKKTARKKKKKAEEKAAKAREEVCGGGGNVMSHAVMRAIGMVGRKRLRVASQPISTAAAKAERNFAAVGLERDEKARDAFFLDLPVNPLEEEHFKKDNLKPDGYLCLKLEIFLTHEPCMMCSMALVHSRVGRVIFKNRMPKTGGLTAEMVRNDSGPVGLGYGLCWRKELNWQFMCWEFTASQSALQRQRRERRMVNGNTDGNNEDAEEDDENPTTSPEPTDSMFDGDENANLGMPSFTSVHV